MPVREVLQRLGSSEIAEWAAEFNLRAEDEQRAIDEAQVEAEKEPG